MWKLPLILLFALLSMTTYATHLRGGEISVVSVKGLTCRITITVMTNTVSEIKFGGGTLDFGDGATLITPTKNAVTRPDLGDNVGVVTFAVEHTYASEGFYAISYSEANLSANILNMYNSVETKFFIETGIKVSASKLYSSPHFVNLPVLKTTTKSKYVSSLTAIDSLTNDTFYQYSLVVPKQGRTTSVVDYVMPDSISINGNNGMLKWGTRFNNKYSLGEYWITARIEKYTVDKELLAYVHRSFQIVVDDGTAVKGMTGSLSDPDNLVVVQNGETKTITATFTKGSSAVKPEVHFSGLIKSNVTVTTDFKDPVWTITLKLNTTPDIVSDIPYPITVRGVVKQDLNVGSIAGPFVVDITFLYATSTAPPPVVVVAGIEEQNNIKVYPIPFQNELYVDGAITGDVTFLDSFGRVVLKSIFTQGVPVNTASLPAGLYLVKVGDEIHKVIRN